MKQVAYVCEGTCKAEITKEQYDNGLTHCGAENCTKHGHVFTPVNSEKKEETKSA